MTSNHVTNISLPRLLVGDAFYYKKHKTSFVMKTHMWMKSAALLTLFVLGVYTAALAAAIGNHAAAAPVNHPAEPVAESRNRHEEALLRYIRSHIGFPEFLIREESGTLAKVLVEVSPDGQLEVMQVEAADERVTDYISRKLNGLQLTPFEWAWGRTYHFALQFRFIKS